MQAHLLIN